MKASASRSPGIAPQSPHRHCAVICLLLLTACGRQPAAPTAATPVIAQPVHARDVLADVPNLPVEIAARYANALSFRIPGKLVERTVRLGDMVRAGQIVARLDDMDARSQLQAALAAAQAAQHRLTYAQAQWERDRAQAAQNLIATSQLEQTEDAHAAAVAGRDQAAAQLVQAQDALRYTTLAADHDGVISSEDADTGQVVSAGQPVFGLVWGADVDAILDAPAGMVAALHPGAQALVSIPALPQRSFAARVREVAPAADAQSRAWRVKLTLLQPPPQLRPGMTGTAAILPERGVGAAADPAFELPATALFHNGTQPAVWVVRPDSTLELRTVATGRYDQRTVSITAGLRDGEQVVLAGVHTVYSGEHVRVSAPLYEDTDGAGAADSAASSSGGPR